MQNDNRWSPSDSMTVPGTPLSAGSTLLSASQNTGGEMTPRRKPSFHLDTSSDEEEETYPVPSNSINAQSMNTAVDLVPPLSSSSSSQKRAYSVTDSTQKLARQRQQQSQDQRSQNLSRNVGLSQYQQTDPQLPHVRIKSDLVHRFSSESLHSFSFAFISQNSISSRLDILKRSLEFLRDNPALTNMNRFPSTSSTTALEGFFKTSSSSTARRGQLRSSSSSAALSILSNYPSISPAPGLVSGLSSRVPPSNNNSTSSKQLNNPGGLLSPNMISRSNNNQNLRNQPTSSLLPSGTSSFTGEPAHTLFDNNLKSVLTLLENAHVFPASVSDASISPFSTEYPYSPASKYNASEDKSLSFSPNTRSITNPPILLSANPFNKTSSSSPFSNSYKSSYNSASNQFSGHKQNSDSQKNLLEPVKLRKRTKTNVATFHLQSQLLDALATPYYDPSWTTLIQRAGSSASMPTINTSASTVDLKSIENTAPVFSSAAAILHPLSSKYSSNQAVFTTSSKEPYLILASNDISCLVFGMSKAEIRRQNIIDIVRGEYKDVILEKARGSLSNTTFLCGKLVPIVKFNGQTGLAAFFAKKHNSGIIAWVIEEVANDRANIDVDLDTGKFTLSGPQHDVLFPFIDSSASDLKLHDIISGIPEDLHFLAANLRKGECHTEQHVTISGNTIVPCNIQEDISNDRRTQENILSIQLTSLPHISGIILLDPSSMTIADYNASVIEQIFGYSSCQDKGCVGWSIDDLIPNFTSYVSRIETTCNLDLKGTANQGLVVPEHLFRKIAVELQMEEKRSNVSSDFFAFGQDDNTNDTKISIDDVLATPTGTTEHDRTSSNTEDYAHENTTKTKFDSEGFSSNNRLDRTSAFMSSKGIEGQHKDGILITIDVQMRIIGDGNAALWVTYSRNITGQNESNTLPSQLSLLSMKKSVQSRLKKSPSTKSHRSNLSITSIDSEKSDTPKERHSNTSTQSGDSNISLSSLSENTEPHSLPKLNTNIISPTQSNKTNSDSAPKTPTSASSTTNFVQSPNASKHTTTSAIASTKEKDVSHRNVDGEHSVVFGSLTPTTSSSKADELKLMSTPRAQIISRVLDETPSSASSVYSIHIPELGARRREKKLSDFKILKTMGEGAFGKVILAEYAADPPLRVVIKSAIKERILVDNWTRDRKLGTIPREIKVMAVLSKWPQENVIKLLDFFEDDNYFHIEMEPHGNPGSDLFDLIEMKQEMVEQMVKTLFKQVLAAVLHLHNHDIVHRDIKDENVIVDLSQLSEGIENEDGTYGNDTENGGVGPGAVKLIDFGSSAFVRQGPFDLFVGTLDYAAPEVLTGEPYEGRPQDVWALGILLYTLIYKENPFYNVDEIMERDLRIPFIMSKESIHLVIKILTRNIDERPTAQEIWDHPWVQNQKLTREMETELEELMKTRMSQNGDEKKDNENSESNSTATNNDN